MKKTDRPSLLDQKSIILDGAIENTNEGFVTIDERHRVIVFNKAAEKIFGYTRKEVVGKDLKLILGPECTEGHKKAVAHFIKTKTPKLIGHQTEFLATRKNGERFPLSISFSVSEIAGKFFFTGIIQDLTETKALREQIAKSEQLAALGRLVAEISHEIKNPLVLIGGFARQLLKNAPDEKSQSKLKIISNEVQRLENLLLELREIYRPPNLSIRSININTLLQEMVSLSQENCESKEITLHFQTDQDPLWIKGDPEKLKQVFLNLIKNAIEAMDKGGRLIIRSRLSGDQVEIAVIDNGPGIQPKDQAKLFTPFFTTKQRGTGLGLSVSKKIIEDHSGGSLNLESQEGRGTIVKITLPLTGHQKD